MSKNTLTLLLKKHKSELRQLLNYQCPDEFLTGPTEDYLAHRRKLKVELFEVEFLIKQLKAFRYENDKTI